MVCPSRKQRPAFPYQCPGCGSQGSKSSDKIRAVCLIHRQSADGRWQAMTPAEQVGIMQQATQGHMSLEAIGTTDAP
jgi:hypothetical protein